MEDYKLSYRLQPLMSIKGSFMTEARITGIQLFEFDIGTCYQAGKGTLRSCRYGLLQINCGSCTGWGECVMSVNDSSFDIVKWASFLHSLKGMTLQEALITTRLHRILWGGNKADMTQTALLDLSARMEAEANWKENEGYPEPASLRKFATHTAGTGFDLEPEELFQKSSAYYSVLT
ncbi:hypothetical protein ACE41H_17310 [Paenibacillus enshidis]|uniref:Uncharacterized protein n=1 Tax=Paenibacillus enshidis TaxID=1458439 RepID=A0ABV5AYS3_9BACL